MAKQKQPIAKDSQQIEQIATAKLIPYARNARTHSEQQVQQIAGSIQEFGFCNPVLIDAQNGIIAGHGRVMAAQLLKLESVPCLRLSHLTDAQKRAYVLADNRIALSSGWDTEMLANELSDLHADEFNMALLGFDADELTALMDLDLTGEEEPSGEIVEDEVPEVPVDPITKLGNLWILGEHRLLCGDSTKAEDVGRLLGDQRPFLMVTDPPYGVNLDQSWRDAALGDKAMGPGNAFKVENDQRADWTEAWTLFPGDVAYIWHAGKFTDVVMQSLRNVKFEPVQQIIWNKSVMIMGRSDYHFKHEPCWYAVKKGKTHGWTGDRKQVTVIDAAPPNHIMGGSKEEKTPHPTQKPVACMFELIKNHAGDIYEPFCGSGTTLIAAEQLNRKCYGMEISPAYCDVIVKRWENLTGKTAVLDGQQALQGASS
jgi:DNA modification methylase